MRCCWSRTSQAEQVWDDDIERDLLSDVLEDRESPGALKAQGRTSDLRRMNTYLLTIILMLVFATVANAQHTPNRISPARQHVVRVLNAGLAGTPMAHTGKQLEAAGWKHHVHPAFMAAVSAIESSWGRRVCEPFNAWGLGSCRRAWTPPSFRSWAHAYDYYARFLKARWPHARSPYDYRGYCVDRYGNDCPTWARDVAWNMSRLGFGPTVRYGR